MSEIDIRIEGCAGRITLRRPKALNALTYSMMSAIEAAIDGWAGDAGVRLVLIDAEGDRAFCAGGDIAEMYATGTAGDFGYGQRFWRDEYRLNAKLAEYAKPVVSFLQGFTMGGGVGIGCHGGHRIVGDSSQIAMPECGIGLVPDVGGSYLLARAPGRLGEYLGLSGARMGPGEAILAGFADHYLAEAGWEALKARLCASGDAGEIETAALPAPAPQFDLAKVDYFFAGPALGDIVKALSAADGPFAAEALTALGRGAPLSMACTLEILRRLRTQVLTIRAALDLEYRFTYRAMQHGDFLEGIRSAIIDKDRRPRWRHKLGAVPPDEIERMLAPLGPDALKWETTT